MIPRITRKIGSLNLCALAVVWATGVKANERDFEVEDRFSFLEQKNSGEAAEIIKSHGFREDQVGFVVFDLGRDKNYEELNVGDMFIPASVTKALTASAAADLGKASQKRGVVIYQTGRVKNGALYGDLYLSAGGYADLNDNDLGDIARRIRSMGISSVLGKLYFDDYVLDSFENISPIFGGSHTYNPSVSYLNFNKNLIILKLEKSSDSWAVSNTNLTQYIDVDFHSDSTLSKERAFWVGDDKSGTWKINTTKLPEDESSIEFSVPIKNVSWYAAERLREELNNRGVYLERVGRRRVPDSNVRVLAVKNGETLKKDIAYTLFTSNNLFAELLGVLVAKKRNRYFEGSIHTAGKELENYWEARAGISPEDLVIKNSSGLTPFNWLTPNAMKKSLLEMWPQKLSDRSRFVGLMHKIDISDQRDDNGEERSVRRCSDLWSKTGALSYVRSLAGYFCSKKGDVKGFAVFINDQWARSVLNTKGEHPEYDRVAAEAGDWSKKSRQLRSDLLRSWINKH